MSKLEELIAELCPDGVEWKELGDIAEIVRGNGLQKSDFTEDGVGCIHYGQIYTRFGLFADKTLTFVSKELAHRLKKVNKGDLVVAITSENYEDICKCVVWLGDEEIVTGGHSAIVKHNQDSKYLAYCFNTLDFLKQKIKLAQGTKVMEMSPERLARIKLPVPPLEVQREIVRILDDFTLYQNELAAELAARKKQYEYYRDSLLTFSKDDANVKWMKLGDVVIKASKINWKKTDPRNKYEYIDISSVNRESNCVDQTTTIDAENAPSRAQQIVHTNDILFSTTRPLLKKYAKIFVMYDNQICSTGFCVLRANEMLVLPSWIYHMISTDSFYGWVERYQTEGSYPAITDDNVKKYPIPVPPLSEQQRIVDILDRFDTLCNDITKGLPAEIEARKKQYEYFRDKLLTFKEKEA